MAEEAVNPGSALQGIEYQGNEFASLLKKEFKPKSDDAKSAVEQALLLAPGPEITPCDLFGAAGPTDGAAPSASPSAVAGGLPFREAKERVVEAFERDFLLQALRRHGGNITKAAEDVGMYRQNFQQKMRELGITTEDQ